MQKTTSAERRGRTVRLSAPTPPLPAVIDKNGQPDFLDSCDRDRSAREAIAQGMDVTLFDWTQPATAQQCEDNLTELRKWERDRDEQRERKRSNRSHTPQLDGIEELKSASAAKILATVESKLSIAPDGQRDELTRNAIYDMAKFVNEGYLSEGDVTDAIVRAARANGLAKDRANGGLSKIRRDIPRGIAKARAAGITVDWTRFDSLFPDSKPAKARADSSESARRADEFAEDDQSPLDRLGVTAEWLDGQTFGELEYAVPQLIPEGFGIVAAPPKKGKSFLVGNLAMAVACGGTALGCLRVKQRPVLYLALEDGYRRLQDRLRRLNAGQPLPPNLTLIIKATPAEAIDAISEYLKRYGADRPFVIVDTLGKVKRPKRSGEESYQADYSVGAQFKDLAESAPGSTVLVVHHTRKAVVDDFVDALSGTQGLAGSADFVMVLNRERNSDSAVLRVTGRDVVEADYGLFADDGVYWRLEGEDLDSSKSAAEFIARTAELEARFGRRAVEIVRFVSEGQELVTPAIIASQFGMESKQASQILTRLGNAGHLAKMSRGQYGPGY